MSGSRPTSLALLASANRPTLEDILDDAAPPPWSLADFVAYLSRTRCLETLEFTLDAKRYKRAHAEAVQAGGSDHICDMWQRIMSAYILPCGQREVNLPAPVRDRLLGLRCSSSLPPDPCELDDAVRIVHELMNDSALLPFLEAAAADDEPEPRQGRTRQRTPKDGSPTLNSETSRSPRASFIPQLGFGRRSEGQSRSVDAIDRDGLSDDSGGSTSPSGEPLTPPTTPPTSDWAFGASPTGLQRVISARNRGWRHVSVKLGLAGRGRSGRRAAANTNSLPAPSSAPPPDGDLHMADAASPSSHSYSSSSPL